MENQNEATGTNEGLAANVRRRRTARGDHGPQREAEGRAKRVPLGGFQPKLNASNRPGYVRRWINDDRQRLQAALQAGYEFVLQDPEAKSDEANKISQIVGSKDAGGALRAYLMEIPEEWYIEDQAAKQANIDTTENLIKGGALVQKPGVDGAYNKHISIKRA